MLTIQQMMRAIRDLQARVSVLESKVPEKQEVVSVDLEPVIRRGRPKKVDAADTTTSTEI